MRSIPDLIVELIESVPFLRNNKTAIAGLLLVGLGAAGFFVPVPPELADMVRIVAGALMANGLGYMALRRSVTKAERRRTAEIESLAAAVSAIGQYNHELSSRMPKQLAKGRR